MLNLPTFHLAVGMPGPSEILLILAVLLLLFGAKKLPELARSMGNSITQFKRGLKDSEQLPEGEEKSEPESK